MEIVMDKHLCVGDKLTGFHGNKGVISKIMPSCDLPFDEEGNIIDMAISNLSVYGRLNCSQMHETKLAGLAIHLENFIRDLKKISNRNFAIKKLNSLKDFLGEEIEDHIFFVTNNFSSLDEDIISFLIE